MKRKAELIFLLLIATIYSGCSTLNVTSDYDKTVDFAKYKTFSIYKFKKSESISELNEARIVKYIKAEMIKKGFVLNDEKPDLLVNLTAVIQDKKSVTANTYGYGGYYRPYTWGSGMGSTTTYDVYNYKSGSLFIDIIDATANKLVWQGTGNKEIDAPSKDPDRTISDAITKIMATFPPGKVAAK